jgi:hypothetical protein
MTPPVKKCPLCLNVRTLRMSHCIPASIYRLLRANQSKHPNPVVFTKEVAVQSSRQWQAYLLCNECEQRLSSRGEKYTIANCCRGYEGPFPLRVALENAPRQTQDQVSFCFTSETTINAAAVAYFGLSIFWRAAIHEWNLGDVRRTLPLSRNARERLRRFLIGETDVLPRMGLVVQVSDVRPWPLQFACFPQVRDQQPNLREYMFFIPGISFLLLDGDVPENMQSICAARSPQRILVLTPNSEVGIRETVKRHLAKATSRVKFTLPA